MPDSEIGLWNNKPWETEPATLLPGGVAEYNKELSWLERLQPTEPNPLLQKIGYYFGGALEKLLLPATIAGETYREAERGFEAVPPQGVFESHWAYEKRLKDLGIEKSKREFVAPWEGEKWLEAQNLMPEDIERYKQLLPSGETYEEYQALPWTQQLKYETPFWGAMTLLPGMGATRAALAPAAVRGGIRGGAAIATRGALLPLATIEKGAGLLIRGAIQLPLKGVSVGTRKLFNTALNAGLDKWIARTGRIHPNYRNKFVSYFLEKNDSWLIRKADENIVKRMAERRAKNQTIKVAAEMAADDTMKQAEPLLLQSAKDFEVAVIKPRVTPKVEPTIPEVGIKPITEAMATNAQKIEAHRIAFNKLLINPKTNKVKPQYRRLAEAMTGETSMTKMTEAEADYFIEALKKLPEPTRRGVTLRPPTIPIKKKLVPEEFFASKFGEPTPIKYITSQTYYAQKLGVKPLVEDLEIGKNTIDIEYPKLANTVEKKINEINKVGKTSVKEKVAAKIRNRPTEAVKRMRDLLNKFEEAPAELSPKERELFNWFRELNRTTLEAENKVRASLGIEEIPYRQAYVRHIADRQAWEVLEGQRGLPPDLEYWSKLIVGKRIYNPMEMQRQLADELEAYFTKDLEYATKSMLWTALKEIHLSQPLATFTEQIAAFSKELPVYEGLTGAELERIRKVSVMPASTRKWVTDYVNIVIKGQQTETDAMINRIVTQSGLGGIFDKILKPFGRSVGQAPLTKLAQLTGRVIINSVIGTRPKLIIRNLWQNTQNIALYGVLNATKAIFPAPKVCRELMRESLFLQGYARVEELPNSAMGVIERIWMAAYGRSAIFNAGNGMKAAYYDTLDLITNPKYKEYGWADPARTYTEPKNFVYPSERARLLREMEFGSGCTQYQYIAMAMPEIFRHKTLIPATRLQSWWMNYFAKFQREALHRFIKGETSYGMKLPWNRRVNWLKYMILGGAILTAMGYKRSYMTGVLPFYMSPGIQIAIGMYNYLLAPNEWQRERAKKQMFYSWRAFVPGSLAWNDFSAVWSGEKPLSTLFFYTEDWPPHKPTWGIPALEVKDPYEQIEATVWKQYPGLKAKSDAIKELEKTDPAKARKMLYEDPDGAQILEARRLIAQAHNELKRKEAMEERALAER